ncbi:hypothetical protein D7S86_01250 [Pararobbsia silviterrae]|uniref:Uncharacterized protein n=1 Tax=Pararobbsia silviterrae TaxID=1792498 RepID=A0A494Y7B3_9BURK|nr:hypothetical protein D7S86_01250 [Pararobbsia silviterrae]
MSRSAAQGRPARHERTAARRRDAEDPAPDVCIARSLCEIESLGSRHHDPLRNACLNRVGTIDPAP